jgi:2-methyl-3-hydroxypyridine 5-carboxylic acid dioxygenase
VKRSVEIAGGGIAGLTTGLAFAQKGWLVQVHEQDSALRLLNAGIYIWENGLRVLDALGVLPRLIAGGIPAGAAQPWRQGVRQQPYRPRFSPVRAAARDAADGAA